MRPREPISLNELNYAPPSLASKIRVVAFFQKMMIICVALSFIVPIATIMFNLIAPEMALPVVPLQLGVAAGAGLYLLASVFALRLGVILFEPRTGILLAVLTLLPVAGLVYFSLINGRATSALRRRGIEVGGLGAKLGEIATVESAEEAAGKSPDLNI